VVTADAAYASRARVELMHAEGDWYVMALPRTWQSANGKACKALVTCLPRWRRGGPRTSRQTAHGARFAFGAYVPGGRPGALPAFGPSDGSEMAPNGQNRVMTFINLPLLSIMSVRKLYCVTLRSHSDGRMP
jgi:hypothetical protein